MGTLLHALGLGGRTFEILEDGAYFRHDGATRRGHSSESGFFFRPGAVLGTYPLSENDRLVNERLESGICGLRLSDRRG